MTTAGPATVTRRDDDGHIYQVPAHLAGRFDELKQAIEATEAYSDAWYDANDALSDEFGQYMA